jgi:hypothetical protein
MMLAYGRHGLSELAKSTSGRTPRFRNAARGNLLAARQSIGRATGVIRRGPPETKVRAVQPAGVHGDACLGATAHWLLSGFVLSMEGRGTHDERVLHRPRGLPQRGDDRANPQKFAAGLPTLVEDRMPGDLGSPSGF